MSDKDKAWNESNEDVEGWLRDHGLEIVKTKDRPGGGRLWVPKECVCERKEADGALHVERYPSGKLAANCKHDNCPIRSAADSRDPTESGWKEVRRRVDPDYNPRAAENGDHDSRLLRDRDAVRSRPQAVPLWGFEKPPPLIWTVSGFLPSGFVTLLAADGGTGKSYLAIYLAIMVCLGLPFMGLATVRGRVLYVDYELDEDEQKRRVCRVLAGLGMTPDDPRLEGRFYYYRPRSPLSSEAAHEEVVGLIREHEISLVILDSLSIGMGADAASQQDVTRIMQRFRDWGTVFAIDHVSGQAARGNQSRARPFGSVFKRNVARSTFTLARADGGGHLLTSDKANFGPQQDLLCYAVDFLEKGEQVTFRRLDHADEEMTGAARHMTTHEVTLLAIKSVYRDASAGVSAEDVVAWRGEHDEADSVKAGTVRNHFTVLKRQGKIEMQGDGRVVPAEAAYTVHDAVHDAGGEAGRDRPKHREDGHS